MWKKVLFKVENPTDGISSQDSDISWVTQVLHNPILEIKKGDLLL